MFDLRYLVSFSRKIDKVRQGSTHSFMLNQHGAVNGLRPNPPLRRRHPAWLLAGRPQLQGCASKHHVSSKPLQSRVSVSERAASQLQKLPDADA